MRILSHITTRTSLNTGFIYMIVFLENSNLLDVDTGIIAHGCNAQGVMGSGVAKQIRAQYPEVYSSYRQHLSNCRKLRTDCLGTVDFPPVSPKLWVANMITQRSYGREGVQYVCYQAMSDTMTLALTFARENSLDLHIPYMVGGGLGGGDISHITEIYQKCSSIVRRDIYCHRLSE